MKSTQTHQGTLNWICIINEFYFVFLVYLVLGFSGSTLYFKQKNPADH